MVKNNITIEIISYDDEESLLMKVQAASYCIGAYRECLIWREEFKEISEVISAYSTTLEYECAVDFRDFHATIEGHPQVTFSISFSRKTLDDRVSAKVYIAIDDVRETHQSCYFTVETNIDSVNRFGECLKNLNNDNRHNICLLNNSI